jgi:hypothetical protein
MFLVRVIYAGKSQVTASPLLHRRIKKTWLSKSVIFCQNDFLMNKKEMQLSLLSLIDYSLLVIFFIGIAGLLILSTRSRQQQVVAPAIAPSMREAPVAYLLLAGLFLLLIILTALTQKRGKQNNALG